jgi:hypothetical protein
MIKALTKREWLIAAGLVGLWACLFLPNLRTSPKWYGDEGEWMEKCWQFAHGRLHIGPIINDFIYPYPYPPLYMAVNGALLRVFGNDVVVGRALGAVTALAAAGLLFWIGCRLRDKTFGFLCAGAFLVYSEAVINFRWVRSHPFAGMLCLAAVGFLIRYVQEKRVRDAALAGLMCALAKATNYFTYPLCVAVVVTVVGVNWKSWKSGRMWGHTAAAAGMAGSYVVLFVIWYAATRGLDQLREHLRLLTSVAGNEVQPTWAAELGRIAQNVWNIGFETPAKVGFQGVEGWDWWVRIAWVGFLFLPVKDWRLRLWVPFFLLALMYGVFKKLNNVPLFFYPATIFLPLMAVGFAGVLTWVGEGIQRLGAPAGARVWPGIIGCAFFAVNTWPGAWSHFDTKIDHWAQQSHVDAEAAMRYVNDRTTTNDVVIVPKQIYWLVKDAKRTMLTYCARYNGIDNDMPVATPIRRELFWFDCRLENAKYLVLEYGAREVVLPDGRRGQLPAGIDATYTVPVLKGVREILQQTQTEKWPVVFRQGLYHVLANPRFVKEPS